MSHSIQTMPRPIRRRLKRTVQKTRCKDHVRRALALLYLAAGHSVSETARRVCAARSTVQQWHCDGQVLIPPPVSIRMAPEVRRWLEVGAQLPKLMTYLRWTVL